jgi:hypothetical protein
LESQGALLFEGAGREDWGSLGCWGAVLPNLYLFYCSEDEDRKVGSPDG